MLSFCFRGGVWRHGSAWRVPRSEEHTSELQSRVDLVCRLLLEKKQLPDYRLRQVLRYPAHGQMRVGHEVVLRVDAPAGATRPLPRLHAVERRERAFRALDAPH